MGKTSIGDEAIELVTNFPKLKKLRVANSHITAAGLSMLPRLENLEELDLSECSQFFDDAMPPLAKMKNLKKLNLWRVAISDVGIEHLAGLTSLQSLNLDNTMLSDEGMKHLSGLTQLTFLHLGSTQITDAGLEHLEALTALMKLVVTRTAVTEKGVERLRKHLPDTEVQLEYIEGQ